MARGTIRRMVERSACHPVFEEALIRSAVLLRKQELSTVRAQTNAPACAEARRLIFHPVFEETLMRGAQVGEGN
jgi:hypothetical protein